MLRKFVTIQDEDGTDVRFNPHAVESIESAGDDGTLIHMMSGKNYITKMPIDTLEKQMEKAAII